MKEVTAKDWLKRIDRSKRYRDQIKERQNWLRLLDEYKNEYKINNQSIKAPPINILYGYVQTVISKIYFRDPHITVNPIGAQFIDSAKVKELMVNQDFKELNIKNEMERVLIDALIVGHSWLKLGMDIETGEFGEPTTENSEYIKKEEMFVSYVPWEDMLFDIVLCKDPPHDTSWVAQRIVRPLDDIKNNPRYKNTAKLSANYTVRDYRGEKIDETLKDTDTDLLEFWEIWDKTSNKILCVTEGTDDFIREDKNNLEMNGVPFCMIKFNIVSGEPYPISDAYIIEPQILEKIKLRAGQLNHVKRWSRQLSVEKGAMTQEEIDKFEQGIDGALIQREKGFSPPIPVEYANMQSEVFVLDELVQKDMDMVIGQSDLDRGTTQQQKKPLKYQLVEQQQATNNRQGKRQDKLEDFMEEMADKMISLRQQFQTTPKYIGMDNMKPEEITTAFPGLQSDGMGIYYTKENLQGKHTVDAKVGSTLPMNRENRVRIMESLLQAGPAIGIVPGSPVSFEIGKELIRELDLKGVEKAYDQQIQMMQQATMQQQQAPPTQVPHPAPPNIVHHVHHQAPVGATPPMQAGAPPVAMPT